jgi:uncharacterized coiled-coil protein SlyX
MLLGRFKELEETAIRTEYIVDGLVEEVSTMRMNVSVIEKKLIELSEKIKLLEEKEVTEVTPQEERNIKMQNKDGLYSYQRYKSFVNGTRKEEE